MAFDLQLRYQHPGLGDDLSEDPVAAADVDMARRVGAKLNEHYPGQAWYVEVSHAQGVVLINIPALMAQKRYVVKISDLLTDPMMKRIVEAGGNILERYRLPRAGFSAAEFLTALRAQPIGAGHVPD